MATIILSTNERVKTEETKDFIYSQLTYPESMEIGFVRVKQKMSISNMDNETRYEFEETLINRNHIVQILEH